MNIAHILPYAARYPLQKHNGRYEWALRLATAQARDGHTVTIYAGPSSATIHPAITFKTLADTTGISKTDNAALFEHAFQESSHHIYHSHLDSLHYEVADKTTRPIVVTQHWFPDAGIAEAVPLNTHRNVTAVPVTHFMAEADQRLGIPAAKTIYHGIDLQTFPLSAGPRNDRLLFVGRIAPHKGVAETVQAALAAGIGLDIVGKINAKDQAYWDSILPYIDTATIRYLGAKDQHEVAALMGKAKAMLFMPAHLEAFGQTIIEAQACGAPVILNDLGANSELVEHGVTGYILKDGLTLPEALAKLETIRPEACRKFAERFDLESMVRSYEALYQDLLQ